MTRTTDPTPTHTWGLACPILLNWMTLFGERNLLRCLRDSTAHDHAAGNHQGIGNEWIDGGELPELGPIESRERLGGLLQ